VNECISYQNLFDATKAWKEYDISFGLSDYMLKRKEGFAEMLQLGIVISADYEDKMWYELGSTRSANKPYIKITHEPLTPTVSAMSPSANSTSARSSPITFNWSHGYDVSGNGALLVTPIQKSAKLCYRVTGAGSYTEKSITGATNSYTIPANTLTTDSSEWQVVITDDNNRTVTSAWVQFNSPQAPGNPTILYPNKTAIDTTRENTFAWQHNFIAPQDAAQIEFDYGYITETVDIGSAQSYTAPANSLSWGNSFSVAIKCCPVKELSRLSIRLRECQEPDRLSAVRTLDTDLFRCTCPSNGIESGRGPQPAQGDGPDEADVPLRRREP
jgi:hypothetical protein